MDTTRHAIASIVGVVASRQYVGGTTIIYLLYNYTTIQHYENLPVLIKIGNAIIVKITQTQLIKLVS